jgi:hypothetical protein
LVAVLPIAVELPIALLTHAHHSGLLIGVGLGAGAAAAMVLFDSPPAHVGRWRIGADGEKATARQFRPLCGRGWTLFNDIDTGHGNIDHVLVGPAGVFMLESKRLAGQVRVEAGRLVVRWHEDPKDGYENESIANRARGQRSIYTRASMSPVRAPGSKPSSYSGRRLSGEPARRFAWGWGGSTERTRLTEPATAAPVADRAGYGGTGG